MPNFHRAFLERSTALSIDARAFLCEFLRTHSSTTTLHCLSALHGSIPPVSHHAAPAELLAELQQSRTTEHLQQPLQRLSQCFTPSGTDSLHVQLISLTPTISRVSQELVDQLELIISLCRMFSMDHTDHCQRHCWNLTCCLTAAVDFSITRRSSAVESIPIAQQFMLRVLRSEISPVSHDAPPLPNQLQLPVPPSSLKPLVSAFSQWWPPTTSAASEDSILQPIALIAFLRSVIRFSFNTNGGAFESQLNAIYPLSPIDAVLPWSSASSEFPLDFVHLTLLALYQHCICSRLTPALLPWDPQCQAILTTLFSPAAAAVEPSASIATTTAVVSSTAPDFVLDRPSPFIVTLGEHLFAAIGDLDQLLTQLNLPPQQLQHSVQFIGLLVQQSILLQSARFCPTANSQIIADFQHLQQILESIRVTITPWVHRVATGGQLKLEELCQ